MLWLLDSSFLIFGQIKLVSPQVRAHQKQNALRQSSATKSLHKNEQRPMPNLICSKTPSPQDRINLTHCREAKGNILSSPANAQK